MFRSSAIIWFQLENVRGARQFQALWYLAEGLFLLQIFLQKKKGFLYQRSIYEIVKDAFKEFKNKIIQ